MLSSFSTLIRIFFEEELLSGQSVMKGDREAHYLSRVMRCQTGTQVRLFNETDGEWLAVITEINSKKVVFTPIKQLRPAEKSPPLRLAFSLLKRDATDFVTQKATELGATEIYPLRSERSVADKINAERLRLIAIEAAEQCERSDLPKIYPVQKLTDFLESRPENEKIAVAAERYVPESPGIPDPEIKMILIGPEGGFSPRELEIFQQKPFIKPVSLGKNILKAETAALAGLTLLSVGYF